ncbi:hypothetical protein ABZ553_31255 [Streptomyces sparsogenes]|uniref:hypothetical protein n=1 Tax=Streptomyces sparsogenes TaxID=67365 RepID=UPI0033FD6C16
MLRRRAGGESVEQIQPDLITPTGKRKGQSPSVASIYRALAEHAEWEAYPEGVEQAHADFAAFRVGEFKALHGGLTFPRSEYIGSRDVVASWDRETWHGRCSLF